MNPAHVTLVKTLNDLVKRYNNKEEGINFLDLRNLENYIESQGIVLRDVNHFLNTKL